MEALATKTLLHSCIAYLIERASDILVLQMKWKYFITNFPASSLVTRSILVLFRNPLPCKSHQEHEMQHVQTSLDHVTQNGHLRSKPFTPLPSTLSLKSKNMPHASTKHERTGINKLFNRYISHSPFLYTTTKADDLSQSNYQMHALSNT